jgi:hypothetical protein
MNETFRVRRLPGNPILHRETTAGVGRNINGPSLIPAPPWLEEPLGRYYLYFAHHRGTFIRLATADRLDGPWSVYQPGTLRLAGSHFPAGVRRPHIASPDVHVDVATQTVRMYYHGLDTATRVQHTRVALSRDGISFEARPELLGRPYFRVFRRDGWWYALGTPGILYRSADGLSGFEQGPRLFDRTMRHSALLVRGDELLVFWSRVGDAPERILCSPVGLRGDWRDWRAGPAAEVLAPEQPWEGAGLPLEPSVRGWADEPVCQLRDPAIFNEGEHTYLLYSVAGESGIAIAELDVVPGQSPADAGWRHWAGRADPGLERLRGTAVTMAAVLASFGTALFIEGAAHLTTSVLILAVALTLSIGRSGQRHGDSAPLRLLGLLVLPLVAVAANEIGTRILEHPDLGDVLFVVAFSATIWLRRFGPLAARIGTFATLPLVATLIVPVVGVATPGSGSPGAQRWWPAVIALVALAWASATRLVARRTGLLPAQETRPAGSASSASSASSARTRDTGLRRLLPASTKMALQMAAALTAAFVVGRTFYPAHWTWVVLTAFIVCSGNRGRGDVVHKAIMRALGASVGTLAATTLTGLVPVGNRWSVVAIFAVLAIGLWLRPLNYAYWAACMTAAMALLYGYYGERGVRLFGDRLEEIVIGALLGVAASWFLLPVRSTDVLRRDLSRALAALGEYLAAAGRSGGSLELAGHQARFLRSAADLDRIGNVLRLVPRRWRAGRDHLPAVTAVRRIAAALPALTGSLTSGQPGVPGTDLTALAELGKDVARLRGGLAGRGEPDPVAWTQAADAFTRLGHPPSLPRVTSGPAAPSAPPPPTAPGAPPPPACLAGGSTPSGYPYLLLELPDGQPPDGPQRPGLILGHGQLWPGGGWSTAGPSHWLALSASSTFGRSSPTGRPRLSSALRIRYWTVFLCSVSRSAVAL